MTPKEKARELVDKIQEGFWRDRAVKIWEEDAIYAALIAVDEIIKILYDATDTDEEYGYWTDVKQEIEKL